MRAKVEKRKKEAVEKTVLRQRKEREREREDKEEEKKV